jgi:hypothetical protein
MERVPGRLALRLPHQGEAVELGVVSRHSKRLFYAVYRGQTYVGDAPALNPRLLDADGALLEENAMGLTLHDALVRLAEEDPAPEASLARVAPTAHDLHLDVVLRCSFPVWMAHADGAARYLQQRLRFFPFGASASREP